MIKNPGTDVPTDMLPAYIADVKVPRIPGALALALEQEPRPTLRGRMLAEMATRQVYALLKKQLTPEQVKSDAKYHTGNIIDIADVIFKRRMEQGPFVPNLVFEMDRKNDQ